jgi:hypothetical protein
MKFLIELERRFQKLEFDFSFWNFFFLHLYGMDDFSPKEGILPIER